ncbi:MAG: T9SS type A sorting domain-containing protein [bacterium]|nr:T9SS type A sorting domain-containing protein [bacterium]
MKNLFMVFVILGVQNVFASAPDILWTKHYGGQYNDQANAILQTTDGGYMVCGYGRVTGNTNVWLIKTDSTGDTLWTKALGDTTVYAVGYSIQPTTGNGYIISYSKSSHIGLIKIDSAGNEEWNKLYLSINGGGVAVNAKQTMDGGYIVFSNLTSGTATVLIKTDSNGDTLWTKTYAKSGSNYGFSVIQTADSGYVLCSKANNSLWVIRTNISGDTLWTKTFPGTGYNMQKTTDGGYIIGGGLNNDVWLLKIDDNGNEQWSNTLGGNYANSVQQTKDGGYIVCGINGPDGYLVKTDTAGTMQWSHTFNDTAQNEWTSVQQTKDNGYVVCGFRAPHGVRDVLLMKTGAEVSVEEGKQSNLIFFKIKISPNPFFQQAVINYQLSKESHILLTICDITGRTIKTLVNEEKEAGSYSVDFNAKGLSTGIYFVQFKTGTYQSRQKLILIK